MSDPKELAAEIEFRRYARASGQVLCLSHDVWWLPETGCARCKAVI